MSRGSVRSARRRVFAAACAGSLAWVGACAPVSRTATSAPASQPTTQRAPRSFDTGEAVRARPIEQAIREGVAFIERSQNDDGSWGTGLQTRGLEISSMVPGSHDAFRVGTTALCVMALREAGQHGPTHARGVEYLLQHGESRRDNGQLLYNTWAHVYALQALAQELKADPANTRLRQGVEKQLREMIRYETYMGGWNYYDFDAQTAQPSLAPTSFQTAAGIAALLDAQAARVALPDGLLDRAIRRVEECRLPSGAYLYGSDYRYRVELPANQVKGSIGRTQSNNFALWIAGSKRVAEAQCVEGLRDFFANHAWIDMGRKRPFPHEAWYQTSGYYYYFAHYYAARIIERLPPPQRAQASAKLQTFVLPYQEADGSWWDYAMWDYHKPYGTAYAVMTLLRCRQVDPATSQPAGAMSGGSDPQ